MRLTSESGGWGKGGGNSPFLVSPPLNLRNPLQSPIWKPCNITTICLILLSVWVQLNAYICFTRFFHGILLESNLSTDHRFTSSCNVLSLINTKCISLSFMLLCISQPVEKKCLTKTKSSSTSVQSLLTYRREHFFSFFFPIVDRKFFFQLRQEVLHLETDGKLKRGLEKNYSWLPLRRDFERLVLEVKR